MADSEKLREYKKQMGAAFSRAAHYNFVDWRHMGYLVHDIDELMDHALQDFPLPDEWRDLFNFTFATYIRWSKTNMQESGQTMGLCIRHWAYGKISANPFPVKRMKPGCLILYLNVWMA